MITLSILKNNFRNYKAKNIYGKGNKRGFICVCVTWLIYEFTIHNYNEI